MTAPNSCSNRASLSERISGALQGRAMSDGRTHCPREPAKVNIWAVASPTTRQPSPAPNRHARVAPVSREPSKWIDLTSRRS